eukprot:gene17442-884_t
MSLRRGQVVETKFQYTHASPSSTKTFFSFEAGERFELVKLGTVDWWQAKKLATGELGYIPTGFIQPVQNTNETGKRSAPPPPKATAAAAAVAPQPAFVALWDYAAQDESELNMAEGDHVTVKNKGNGEGWWLVFNNAGK